MRRLLPSLFACAAILFIWSETFSQQPDNIAERSKFIGVWTYDSKRSTKPSPLYDAETITIIYSEPKLEIKKVQSQKGETKSATLALFTDKRGETNNPFPFNGQEKLDSVSEWKGRSLVRLSTGEIPYKGSKLRIYIREVFSLSKDGNSLTISEEAFTDTPKIFFPDIAKKVYQRN